MTRQLKREVKIGNIKIGGTNPIAVQTMLNVPVKDIAGNVAQAKRVAAAGCQIVRVTVPSPSDAAVVAAIKEAVDIPVVADIHFDYRAALAALAARFKRVEEWLAPPVLAMKTVPVASFVILALIWFGSRNLSVFIALVMVFPVIYTNVLAGVRAADRELAEMARVFRIPLLRRIRCITLPQVAPYFRAGCALGLGLCWKAGVAAEVIGMPVPSIGERLQQAKVYLDTPELFAWTLVIVLISVGFEKLFMAALGALERRLTRL